jgi:NADPH-dependent 2,4-dienoyl-CoA reductase/sulfur reductase-like enzyme
VTVFAFVFIGLAVGIAVFQIVLALGAPLGEYTLGGKYPGKLPGKLRVAALFQIAILFIFTVMIVSKAGIAFGSLYGVARIGAWVVFAFFIPGSILNLSSPSKKERLVMGPLNIVALICSFMVAIL